VEGHAAVERSPEQGGKRTVRAVDGVGVSGDGPGVDQGIDASEADAVGAFHAPECIDARGAQDGAGKGFCEAHLCGCEAKPVSNESASDMESALLMEWLGSGGESRG
jgi:hypothetical protein